MTTHNNSAIKMETSWAKSVAKPIWGTRNANDVRILLIQSRIKKFKKIQYKKEVSNGQNL